MVPWFADEALVATLPLRYRIYARYSRLLGSARTRRVPGGSLMLRLIRGMSRIAGLDTVMAMQATPDVTLVVDFSDDRILEVMYEIRRENPEYNVMTALLTSGDTFIDVGANYGTFSVIASRIVGDRGSVIAIEPQPRLAGFIGDSARASGIHNLQVMRSGAGAEAGSARLLVPEHDTGRGGMISGFSGRGDHAQLEVSVIRLDDLLPRISATSGVFIKIDVEGSELAVLAGAEELIATRRPALLIELNPWSARAAGSSVDEVVARLQSLGYAEFSLARDFPSRIDAAGIPRGRQENLVARFADSG